MIIQFGHALIVVVLALPLLLIYLRRSRRLSVGHLLAITIFVAYLLVVTSFTVLPLRFDAEHLSQQSFSPPIVLVPFFLDTAGDVMSANQYLGNILLGVPFGFGLRFVVRTSIVGTLFAGVPFSLSIEAVQWVITRFGIAFPSRTVDINDVLLNTFGVTLGVLAFLVVRSLYRTLFDQFDSDTGLGLTSTACWWLSPADGGGEGRLHGSSARRWSGQGSRVR